MAQTLNHLNTSDAHKYFKFDLFQNLNSK